MNVAETAPLHDEISLADRYLPVYDVREYHETRVSASSFRSYETLRALDLRRSVIVRALFAVRTLPSRLLGREPSRPLSSTFLREALDVGWVILEETRGSELAVGAVTQPWAPVVEFRGLSPAAFLRFHEPGYAKIVWSIRAQPTDDGASILSTETRVQTTDPQSQRKFRLYWLALGPGIRLIRLIALRIARKDLRRARRPAVQ